MTALKLKCGIIHILVINTKDIVLSIELNRNIFILVLLFFLKVLYDNNGFDATDSMKNFVEWVKLQEKGMGNTRCYQEKSAKLVCLGHNHTLFKPEKYKGEDEWRIIIPENRYVEYFGKKDVFTNDFSHLMQAVYLGSEFRNTLIREV